MGQTAIADMKQPGVNGKEVEYVTMMKERGAYTRLDTGPFILLGFGLSVSAANKHIEGATLLHNWPLIGLGALCILWILTLLFTHWSVRVRAFVAFIHTLDLNAATCVKVVPAKFAGKKEIIPLQKRVLTREGSSPILEVSFEFRKHKFVYDKETATFDKLRFPVKDTFESYSKSSGYGNLDKLNAALDKWGHNKFEVPVPPFLELMKEQMLAPFFVFQVFCVALWCIDEYWYYSIFTLFMLITFEATVVGQRQRNLRELHSLQTPKQNLFVYRAGKWDAIPGEELLPGDLISVVRPTGAKAEEVVVPADCLLLAGSCIVEEAVLTGESTPQWKVPITDRDPSQHLNIKADKQNCLFGGTKVLQHTGDKNSKIRTPDGGCLAVVLRTGFETAQGQLMRTILYSTERVTANNLETGLFILFLLFFAVSAAYYVLVNGLKDESRSRFKLILNCIMIITSVIPPELPMELSIAVNTSLVMLAKKRVFCTEPFRIPFAGKVDVCCFDKTGTLTSDHLLLEGLAGIKGHAELVTDVKDIPSDVSLVMASCQSLVQIDQQMVGDPLEKASLESSNWSYANDVATSPDRKMKGTILQRFHFSSTLKRMSAVVKVETDSGNGWTHRIVLKGAPEVVRSFLKDVPEDYDRIYKSYAAQGARVIALAHKILPDLDASALRSMTRDEAESGAEFVAFAIFQCPLKDGSEPALSALRHSSHQLMMITGDAPLTACYAASKVHIVTREVLILLHREERIGAEGDSVRTEADSEFVWMSPDETVQEPFSRNWEDVLLLAAQYDLCVAGDALAYLESVGAAAKIIPLCQVYARVSPEQKELVVKTLRASGRVTLMCGDGTNDVGGLKAAHVGVALLSSVEESKGKDGKKKKKDKESGTGDSSALVAQGAPQKKAKAGKKSRGQQMLEEWEKKGRVITPQMQRLAQSLDKLEDQMGGMDAGEPPLLKPGDASMASAFTARASDVMPCTDIIKQGRCTLVTTVQMFKILGLLCLSTAYSLSVMYLQGVKLSDVQATCTGLLTAGMFFFISNAKPLDKLSPERPHPNIFNVYFFLSLMGQFSCHLGMLVYMYHAALRAMPSEERQGSDSDFKPNLVNTVCYLVGAVVQLMTFAVNYVGHPFNTSITENKGLYTCLVYSLGFLAVVASDIIPGLASSFGLVVIPSEMRYTLYALTVLVFFVTYHWEQFLRTTLQARIPKSKGYLEHEEVLMKLTSKKKNL